MYPTLAPANPLRPRSRLSIGDAAVLFNLSHRALRHYEKVGLIHAGRDRVNARFYDAENREKLGWIAAMRAGGLSLGDTAKVLTQLQAGRAPALAAHLLRARLRDLDAQRAAVDAALAKVRDAARSEINALPPEDVAQLEARAWWPVS